MPPGQQENFKRLKHSRRLDWRVTASSSEVILRRPFQTVPVMLVAWFFFIGSLVGTGLILIIPGLVAHRSESDWPVWILVMAYIAFMGFMAVVLYQALPQMVMTSVVLNLTTRTTLMTYLGIFKRHLPELPSHLRIFDGGGPAHTRADLKFSDRKKFVCLFSLKAAFDTAEEGREFALDQTAELRKLLNLEVEFFKPKLAI